MAIDHDPVARRPPQTSYAQSTGAKIAYQVSGAGRPDLVMAPGLVSHLDLQWHQTGYRRFMGALERRCRLIRFDKRGTGLSDPVGDLPTTDERVADMAAVIDAADSAPAVLFGVSDGGRAAIAFAAAHPERVLGLILYGTSYRGPRTALLRRYRSIVRHWGEGRLLDLVAPTVAAPQAREDFAAFERAAASPAMAAALVDSLGPIDIHHQMSAIAVPTLVLHREHDMIPLEDARRLAGQIPGATLRVLPGSDHAPWVGDWRPLVEEILCFVDDIGPPRSESGESGRSSRARRPSMGWPSLTEAERRVAELAGQGLSNRQVAHQLFLSRYTVETHLKHVYAKLGIASRTELAALACHAEDLPANT